jgi:hypothetical protein
MNEGRDDLIEDIEYVDPVYLIEDIDYVMFIQRRNNNTKETSGDTSQSHDHNSIAESILENLYIIPYGNWSDQVLALGGWTKLCAYRKTPTLWEFFEFESKTHEDLQDTLGRIEKHLRDAIKVQLKVWDPNDSDVAHVWKKSIFTYSQLKEYISRGPGYI